MAEQRYSLEGKRVWVAGHRGMVGAAIVDRLASENCAEILTAGRSELDLTRQADVEDWVKANKPDAVFVAAAKVGGILANDTYPYDFLYQNVMIEANIINAAFHQGVEKLLFLGSSCIYPRMAPQPIHENSLLTGPLEPTNEWYAVAKIAGIKLCQALYRQHGADFISAMPTNLYGPNDNYDLQNSHVLPALIRKAHEAKARGEDSIEIWGTGEVWREFMHVRDCADGLVFLMKNYSGYDFVNVGAGSDVTIKQLAETVCDVAGLTGPLRHDLTKPDGTPKKLMASDRINAMGWRPSISLREGVEEVYKNFPQEARA
ncbi:MAG: GDP-L-fucose synthase [Alphaproteobacteria bacterium]|nr:GDP-fucose synthetase [Hyphomonas sp.]MBR9806028.1 GDP-L-fucose synthase [Alphaproteobacteria bacterium]|tara:strand:- start:5281 stop:6231 length:951 start_codon:yes stop_codon:yes gene_type:complete